eukprot:7092636-Pyramimonas_sp.AAC.1
MWLENQGRDACAASRIQPWCESPSSRELGASWRSVIGLWAPTEKLCELGLPPRAPRNGLRKGRGERT